MNMLFVSVLLILHLIIPVPTSIPQSTNVDNPPILFSYITRQELLYQIERIEPEEEEVKEEVKEVRKVITTKAILLTRYYTNDSTGSGQCTSAGKCVNDFKINNRGWYTYKGKVVIATATTVCLRARTGACGRYNTLPLGWSVYHLYDEIVFIVEGRKYTGIVLDSCGACMRINKGEDAQRYDIFTVDGSESSSLSLYRNSGKVSAQVLIGDEK